MEDFLLRFTLEVTVETPIHIGTGDRLSSKSFVITSGDMVVVDDEKLVDWVSADRRRLDAFTRFAEDQAARLSDYLKQAGLGVDSLSAYRIKKNAPSNPRDVLQFIKLPNDQPYLPGSSFRGALRSALLRGYFLQAVPELKSRVGEAARLAVQAQRRNPGQEVEAPIFVPAEGIPSGRRPNYDLMRTMICADSRPVETSMLQVVEVRVLSAQSNQTLRFKDTPHGDRTMQIWAEMLTPGTVLRVPVTVNQALLNGLGAAKALQFKSRRDLIGKFYEYAKRAAENLIEQEIDFYEAHQRQDLAERFRNMQAKSARLPAGAFLMPIGWGSGFDAKTLTDQLDEAVFGQVIENYRNTRRLGRPGGTGAWLGPRLSPKSRKVVYYADDRLEPIGWLRVRILENA